MTLVPLVGKIVLTIALILFAAELFTNAIEWVGHRFRLSQGIVGSVLAAVGTALPETLVAVVAVVLGATGSVAGGHAIGIGAILGAPFMLATMAFLVTGLGYYSAVKLRRRQPPFSVDMNVAGKDLTYFAVAYSIAVLLGLGKYYLFPIGPLMRAVDTVVAVVLIAIYIIYVRLLANAGEQMSDWALSPLHFQCRCDGVPLRRFIFVQLIVALALMFVCSQFFVHEVQELAEIIRIPPLVLSLLLVPVATELPEKFNSVLWVSRGRDTLAMGNISGAMVLQATFPVSVGLLFTEWKFALVSPEAVSAGLALLSTLLLIACWRLTRKLHPALLLAGGLLYIVYFMYILLGSGRLHA